MNNDIALPIGQKVFLARHFDVRVILEDARTLGSGYECCLRLPGDSLEEAVIPFEAANSLAKSSQPTTAGVQPTNPEKIRLRLESARILLAYTDYRQFAPSISGIQTLSRRIEAF